MNRSPAFFPGIDGRSSRARRLRSVYADVVAAVGGGANPNTLQIQLCRRVSTLIVLLEDMESKVASKGNGTGGDGDPDLADRYIRASGALMRVLRSLGLEVAVERGEGDVVTLQDWLASKARKSRRKTLNDKL